MLTWIRDVRRSNNTTSERFPCKLPHVASILRRFRPPHTSCSQRIGAEAHQNIAVKAVQRNCCRILPKMLLRELHRENGCRSSPKYCCQSRQEKLLPNLTKNVATSAAQREWLQKLTKILLSKPSREIAAKSHQKCCYESCPGRKLQQKLTKIMLSKPAREIAVKSHQKCC